jgi:putative DNA primase/helicase
MSQAEPTRNTSDEVLATEFTDAYHKEVRYVGQWNKWLTYDGKSWDFDHKLLVYTHAREHLRAMALKLYECVFGRLCDDIDKNLSAVQRDNAVSEARSKAWGKTNGMLSTSTVHNIVTLSRYDRRVASGVEEWDTDPWLLNTPGGTVDLHTGQMRPHRAKDYIRKVTKTSPDLKMQPTKWLAFLTQIMKGDEEMVRYLQKVFGYCLVGETKEHEMYFAYGTGKNGKGVTLSTVRSLLGGYSMEAAIETFVVNDTSRHPTELADLQGARLVTCGETEEGARWAEARIKLLTGGDPVKARFMRQDFFEYKPQFKLFLAGNHKPRLSNVDQAIERRFRLIPFTYTVPPEDRDVDLEEKLRAEWPAILAWAIDGCLAWQAEGLEPPSAVATATKSYLSQEDALGGWFTECCIAAETAFTPTKDLFNSWAEWARENGEPVGTKRVLARHLEDREPILHISKARREDGMGFKGVELRRPATV